MPTLRANLKPITSAPSLVACTVSGVNSLVRCMPLGPCVAARQDWILSPLQVRSANRELWPGGSSRPRLWWSCRQRHLLPALGVPHRHDLTGREVQSVSGVCLTWGYTHQTLV